MTAMEKYPIRINKYLAVQKICSRREADFLIEQKKVKINGKAAVLGDKVEEKDKVTVENFNKDLVYLAFNKPEGVLTYSPDKKELDIQKLLGKGKKLFPIGRLDKDSSGIIILTNDGRITDRLLNPKYEHEKEYIVQVNQGITADFIKKMAGGVRLDDGYVTRQCVVKRIEKKSFSIILTEGKKRQIRRMCGALGYGVVKLERIRFLNIKINALKPGEFRNIKGDELEEFLHFALGQNS
jgi:23S rRNA pseudouridine2604 synthase